MVEVLLEELPWLISMGVLLFASGFFSSSEAALFYLVPVEIRQLAEGNRAQRQAARLLDHPDRLLSTILFCNLVINVIYFTLASIIGLRLDRLGYAGGAAGFGVVALLTIILLAELLPKALAVLRPKLVSSLASFPLSAATQLLAPMLPIFAAIILISRRVIWPGFEPEPYMEVADLERAVELSTTDAELVEQEKLVLQNVLALSETRVDELMRPRTQYQVFHQPVSLSDLKGSMPESGFVLITEPATDEVALALPLERLSQLPEFHLEQLAEPVLYVPWCTTIGATLAQMQHSGHAVAAVVNEFGETIGVVTLNDILRNVLGSGETRSERLLNQKSIQHVGDDTFHASGLATIRHLAGQLEVDLPETHSVTLAGVVQEVLGHVPSVGDFGNWGPVDFKVLQVGDRGKMLVQLQRRTGQEDAS